MILKNTKTILFASLIVAMILPFGTMDFATAETTDNPNISDTYSHDYIPQTADWSNLEPTNESAKFQLIADGQTTYTKCYNGANMANKCSGYESNGTFYYTTPYSYANVDVCQAWNCADLNFKLIAPSIVSEHGLNYPFISATYIACAPVYGVCTDPITWTSPDGLVVNHNNIPTDTPITHYTVYEYEIHGYTVTYLVVNAMNEGYTI